MVAFGWVTFYSFKRGDLSMLTAPLDGDNNFCGEKDHAQYPYLYITDVSTLNINTVFGSGVCVKKCPKSDTDTLDCKPTEKHPDCTSKYIYQTTGIFGFCVPSKFDSLPEDAKTNYRLAKQQLKDTTVGKYLVDMYYSSTAIIISIFMSLVYVFLFIWIMSIFGKLFSWMAVIATWVGLAGGAYMCWMQRIQKNVQIEKLQKESAGKDMIEAEMDTRWWYTFGAILFAIAAVAFLFCVICNWNQLHNAIDVIDASLDFLADTKRIVFVPMIHFILQITLFIVWCCCFACLISTNTITASKIPQMKNIEWDTSTKWLAFFMIFGLIWGLSLIEYLNNFIIISAASSYYWLNRRDDDEDIPDKEAEILKGVKRAYVDHFGSIVFGSFIIAIIRFIKYTVVYISLKIKGCTGEAGNACVNCLFKCTTFILQCVEEITDYINESAYCYMAVTGDNFCTSAKNAFFIHIEYLFEFSFAALIAKAFMFLGKMAVVVGNCFSLLFIMKVVTKDMDEISSTMGPVLITGVFTYFIASIFLGMLDESVNAMMTSVAIDTKIHDGKPKFGPQSFQESVSLSEDGKIMVNKAKARNKFGGRAK